MEYQISVTIDNSTFMDNQNAHLPLLNIAFWTNIQSKFTYYRVQFINNLGGICLASILVIKGDTEINLYMTNFMYNEYSACTLYISPKDGNNNKILLKKGEFVNNQSPALGAVLYFRIKNYAYIQIQDVNFNQNIGDSGIVYIDTIQSDFPHNNIKINKILKI